MASPSPPRPVTESTSLLPGAELPALAPGLASAPDASQAKATNAASARRKRLMLLAGVGIGVLTLASLVATFGPPPGLPSLNLPFFGGHCGSHACATPKQPLPPVDNSDRDTDARRELIEARRAAVKEAMQHAYGGYRKHAFGHDEVTPVSRRARDNWGGWAVTMVDSLDTMLMMNMTAEFDEAVEHVATINFTRTAGGGSTPVFEMVIRTLGGLLSAYDISGHPVLKRKATEVADALMPAFDTPSGIPHARIHVDSGRPAGGTTICIAEAGTLQLEFQKLAHITGNRAYYEKTQRIVDVLDRLKKPVPGLYPIYLDINRGTFSGGRITLGGQGDSWYEYLLKLDIMHDRRNPQYKRMYLESLESIEKHMVVESHYKEDLWFIGDLDGRGKPMFRSMDHLACFTPGMIALGARHLGRPNDLALAAKLTESCYRMYKHTATGLSPESVYFDDSALSIAPEAMAEMFNATAQHALFAGDDELAPRVRAELTERGFAVNSPAYILRPEVIESIMYMYRTTGDLKYQEWGWEIFRALDAYTRTDTAFSALRHTDQAGAGKQALWLDSMESFFLAETLKYLYLLFSPMDYYSLDDWVFNTEAHPLKIIKQ